MAETAADKRGGVIRWAVLALFLLVLGAAGYLLFGPQGDGRFDHSFRGCDDNENCGRFRIVAPGFDYRWALGRAAFDPVPEGRPALLTIAAEDLAAAEGIIAAGLASREGGDQANRHLSACRSRVLADTLGRAAGGADLYRITLGRYVEDVVESDDTSIERLVVFGLILERDENLNLGQALKNGLQNTLDSALARALEPVARQLNFRKYACWGAEFSVTPADQPRRKCYAEPAAPTASFCDTF